MILQQPDVAITDFLLVLEAVILGILLFSIEVKSRIKVIFFLFYLSLALGSLEGGIVHGFFPQAGSLWNFVLWRATMVSLGIVAIFSWTIAGEIMLPKYRKAITYSALLEFIVYSYYVVFINSQFKIAIYNYALPTVFLLIASK